MCMLHNSLYIHSMQIKVYYSSLCNTNEATSQYSACLNFCGDGTLGHSYYTRKTPQIAQNQVLVGLSRFDLTTVSRFLSKYAAHKPMNWITDA